MPPELLGALNSGRGHQPGRPRVLVKQRSIDSRESSASSISSSGSQEISRNPSNASTRSKNEKRPREGEDLERTGPIRSTISDDIGGVSLAAEAAPAAEAAAHVDQSYVKYIPTPVYSEAEKPAKKPATTRPMAAQPAPEVPESAYAAICIGDQVILPKNFGYISDIAKDAYVWNHPNIQNPTSCIKTDGSIAIVVDTRFHALVDPGLTEFLVQKTVYAVEEYGFVNIKYYSSGFGKEAEVVLNLTDAQVHAILGGVEACFNRIEIQVLLNKGETLDKPAHPVTVNERQIHLQLRSHSGNEIKLKLSYKRQDASLTLPGGSKNPGETTLDCVIRELGEELRCGPEFITSIAAAPKEWWPVKRANIWGSNKYFYTIEVRPDRIADLRRHIERYNSSTTLFGEIYDVQFMNKHTHEQKNANLREWLKPPALPHGRAPGSPYTRK